MSMLDKGPMEDVSALALASRCSQTDLRVLRGIVDRRLGVLVPLRADPCDLDHALRYTLLAPGKRIRPLMTILAAWEFGPRDLRALDAACALEMVHAASLVLDDVPAMDDADMRRGRPAAHVRFGEDVAMLSVVGLLARAFGTLSTAAGISGETRARLVAILAEAVGADGLALGQFRDLREPDASRSADRLAESNHLKTGILFLAAIDMAAALHDVRDERLTALRNCARHLGQAFQLMDDLADGLGGAAAEDEGKAGLLTLLGRPEVHGRLQRHFHQALDCVAPKGQMAALMREIFGPILSAEETGDVALRTT